MTTQAALASPLRYRGEANVIRDGRFIQRATIAIPMV
jgi:hypothetical protein